MSDAGKILSTNERLDFFAEHLESFGFNSEDPSFGSSSLVRDYYIKKVETGTMVCAVTASVTNHNSTIDNNISLSIRKLGRLDSPKRGKLVFIFFEPTITCLNSTAVCLKYLINNFIELSDQIVDDYSISFRPIYDENSITFQTSPINGFKERGNFAIVSQEVGLRIFNKFY